MGRIGYDTVDLITRRVIIAVLYTNLKLVIYASLLGKKEKLQKSGWKITPVLHFEMDGAWLMKLPSQYLKSLITLENLFMTGTYNIRLTPRL